MTISEYINDARSDFLRKDEYRYLSSAIDFEGVDPREFDVPVLYAYGEHGADMYEEKANELASATNVATAEIEGASHLVSLERSEEFNGILRDFLADIHESQQRTEEVSS